MGTLGGPNVWKVSGEERSKHDEQFFTLKPINGFITGDQARGFFLQSGLPSAVLAQIWNLADLNKDGKMDKREFSIAMHLIQKKLQGFSIPPTLPDSLKSDPDPTSSAVFGQVGFVANPQQQPMGGGGGWAQQQQQGIGLQMSGPPSASPQQQHPISSPITIPRSSSGKIDWSMNQTNKLRYSQHFNTIDKGKTGFLAGVHARNIFTQAGLPNPILAQIWNLSDLDKDGRLTVEEFSIAMHLIDMIKMGATLPNVLPMELVPPHLQHQLSRQRTLSFGNDETGSSPPIDDGSAAAQQQKSLASFEDKRRQNFEKGQAELERRRELLREQERREREERERKDRDEFDRRERERLEMERRRQLEMEKLQARQREEQQKQEEEYRRMMEQRDAARREMERQRQADWERQRLIELTNQRQRDQEQLCHAKQKQKNLSFQLQALNEKSQDLNQQVTEMRDKIVGLTSSIESMKRDRDTKLLAIESGKRAAQELKTRSMQLGNEKLRLASQRGIGGGGIGDVAENSVLESYRQVAQTFHNREMNLETLRQSLSDIESELKQRQPGIDEKEKDFDELNRRAKQEANEYRELVERLNETLAKVKQSRGGVGGGFEEEPAWPSNGIAGTGATTAEAPAAGDGFFDDNAWGQAIDQAAAAAGSGTDGAWASAETWKSSNGHSTTTAAAASHEGMPANTVRYRAIYEFNGTNEDELSFQPGDVIIVFKDHHGDEGWLAGQVGNKVGWFPQAFAEPMDSTNEDGSTWTQNDSQMMAPPLPKLDSIQEVPFEREDDARSSTRSANIVGGGQSAAAPTTTATIKTPEAETGELVQAQFAWKAKTENHLSFNKGDQIRILEKQEMWWRGESNGTNGWFPKSYVKSVLDASRRKSETPESSRKPTAMATRTMNNNEIASPTSGPSFKRKSESQEFPSQAVREQRAVEARENGEWYVAIYSFQASESGDLGFEAGDRILVTQKNEDWWTGRAADREGVFPANYVQKSEASESSSSNQNHHHPIVGNNVQEATESSTTTAAPSSEEVGEAIAEYQATDTNQLSLSIGDYVKIRAKSPTGWWEGEIEKKGETKRIGWFPGNYVQVLENAKSTVGQQQDGGEIVEAIFDYVKQQDDELAFNRGDKITVLEKMDENWWKGESMDGQERRGLFPANYVKPLE